MNARKEWLDEDYYAELGVSQGASDDDITKAYRQLARELHPDKNPGDTAAEDRFKKVTAAYDILGDTERRQQYDQVRRFGSQGGGGGQGFTFDFDSSDLDDLLGGMFGGQGPFSGGRRRGGQVFTQSGGHPGAGPTAARGAEHTAQLQLGFREAVEGLTTTVTLTDGTSTRDIKIRIPAGVGDGQTLRLSGKGGAGRNGGPDGDLLVTVSVKPDEVFGRVGNDLTIDLPITYGEAVLGATVAVPTFDGSSVNLKVPSGTSSGQKFRVKGKGVVTDRATGNLMVTVQVSVPTGLTSAQSDALRAFEQLMHEDPRARSEES